MEGSVKSELEAIVLAAGKGTRMRSKRPKVLHSVCGQSMLERVLRAVAASGASRIVIVVGYEADSVKSELRNIAKHELFHGIEIVPVIQEEQNGTGHAVQVAMAAISLNAKRVLIVPGDVPMLSADAVCGLTDVQSATVALLSCDHPSPDGFGRVVRDDLGRPVAIVEHRDCSDKERLIVEINSGIYVVEREFLIEAISTLTTDNSQGELYFTDIVSCAAKKGQSVKVSRVKSHVEISGANTVAELSDLEQTRRKEIVLLHMEQGVSFEDPNQVFIDEDVEIGADSFIGAGTRIRSGCRIAEDVVIEGDSLIWGSSLGSGTKILLGSYIEDSEIGESCTIGPFAHLRPGTYLKNDVKIGNFVETKKSHISAGAKVNHLTYIGDALVGEGSNIGAGTITCNYDGVKKSQTIIGKGAFIGSNTSLVAPVEVGEGSVIGAGSVITKNVPNNALGVTRAQQTNVDGWPVRRRKRNKS